MILEASPDRGGSRRFDQPTGRLFPGFLPLDGFRGRGPDGPELEKDEEWNRQDRTGPILTLRVYLDFRELRLIPMGGRGLR